MPVNKKYLLKYWSVGLLYRNGMITPHMMTQLRRFRQNRYLRNLKYAFTPTPNLPETKRTRFLLKHTVTFQTLVGLYYSYKHSKFWTPELLYFVSHLLFY